MWLVFKLADQWASWTRAVERQLERVDLATPGLIVHNQCNRACATTTTIRWTTTTTRWTTTNIRWTTTTIRWTTINIRWTTNIIIIIIIIIWTDCICVDWLTMWPVLVDRMCRPGKLARKHECAFKRGAA